MTVIDDIIRREGGYVLDSADNGGPTNYGITAVTLGNYRNLGRPATREEVRALTEQEARAIYTERYVTEPRFDMITNVPLREFMIDFGVNSGPTRAVKFLQQLVEVPVDGVIGPVTADAVNAAPALPLKLRMMVKRACFLMRFIERDRRQAKFAKGWANRIEEFI